MKLFPHYTAILLFSLYAALPCGAQDFNPGNITADSWQQVLQQKQGTVTALWYDIDPFIYQQEDGHMAGVEYEIMENFVAFLRRKYKVQLQLNWVDAGSFENIYPYIKQSDQAGLFGWSFYSITDERKKEVQFTPPYMPDLNVVVTNNSMPNYSTNQDFIRDIKQMQAFTMASTTMEQDLLSLKSRFYPELNVSKKFDDYEVLRAIADHANSFGYVPLSIYITALQKNIKVKRQQVLTTKRDGFAGILPLHSDWNVPVNEYFNTADFKVLANKIIRKYLGNDVSELVYKISVTDSLRTVESNIDLLTLEKDIVTQRLIESAVEIEKERNVRNILIAATFCIIIIAVVIYRRILEKQKVNAVLNKQNEIITTQKAAIEKMNDTLELKLLQTRLNPHFIFNSMNAIQYFVGLNDKKTALSYIAGFSKYMRSLMNSSTDVANTVSLEADSLRQYLQLEKQRFHGRFDFAVAVEDKPELQNAEIPTLLVHSFAEYALYHHVLNKAEDGGFIDIRFSNGNDYINISVEDNGVGSIRAKQITDQKETNLGKAKDSYMKDGIELLNKTAAQKIEVATTDITEHNEVKGTKINIHIPIAFVKENLQRS